MTNSKYRESVLADCSMSAQDCKGSADYAAYNFGKGNEAEARMYVGRLEEHVSRLKSHLYTLDHVNKKIAANGPEATE